MPSACVRERESMWMCVWVRVWVRVFQFPTEGKWEWKRADDLFNWWARQGCGHIFQAHTLSLSLSFSFLHTHTLSPTHTFHEWALSISFSLSLSLYFSLYLYLSIFLSFSLKLKYVLEFLKEWPMRGGRYKIKKKTTTWKGLLPALI